MSLCLKESHKEAGGLFDKNELRRAPLIVIGFEIVTETEMPCGCTKMDKGVRLRTNLL